MLKVCNSIGTFACKNQQLKTWRKSFFKCCATASANVQEKGDKKCSYDEFLHRRQTEATRSIVVQVSSEKSFPELYNYCSNFGNIIGAHHYCIQHDDPQHYILIEFSSRQEAAFAIDSSAYNEDSSGVPVRSPFLWFRAASKRAIKLTPKTQPTVSLNTVHGTSMIDDSELSSKLRSAPDIEQQIHVLHQDTQLNHLGVRLRFIAALQLQQALAGMFPAANAQPFGSSVNGFGKMGCDLDLILRFDRELLQNEVKPGKDSRLVFHTKVNLTNGRSQTQRQMESIGDMLHLFLPGVCHVRRILQARVPIIKYHHEHLNLEVDLSMSNLTGFYMSELLYMFGEMDKRVRPLVFCVRRWANACGLTNPSPGRWISNFSLTCLVIFFLQQVKQPILPTVNTLMKAALPEDIRVTEDGINCTFGREIERLRLQSHNKSYINELLLQFFEYYSQFDFSNRAISLNEGRTIAKPDHSALYIVNPLEQVLNVSKNVSLEECERLRIEVRNAAWALESEVESIEQNNQEKLDSSWGLLNLFKTPEKSIIRPHMFFKPRMVEVSELFENKAMEANTTADTAAALIPPAVHTATSTTKAERAKSNTQTKDFKDSHLRHQVHSIKAQARTDLKQMRLNATLETADAFSKGRRTR